MIHLMRHARTPASDAYLTSGPRSRTTPLSPAGRAEASAALPPPAVGLVVTSDYARTAATAALLRLPPGVPQHTDPRLDEVDYGDFDGGPWQDYGHWLETAGPDAVPPGGAESWAGCLARTLDALAGLADSGVPTLVVGHGYQYSALDHHLRTGSLPRPLELGPAPHVTALPLAPGTLTGLARRWAAAAGPDADALVARWSARNPDTAPALRAAVAGLRSLGLRLGTDHAPPRPVIRAATHDGRPVGHLDEDTFTPAAPDGTGTTPIPLGSAGAGTRLLETAARLRTTPPASPPPTAADPTTEEF
ncbi:histidine phosphatase family protein [Streptomyces virginiae]